MRTNRCILFGGPGDGMELHVPVDIGRVRLPEGEIYLRSERRDSENRQIYMLKIGRCIYDLPKQNHFPESH